MRLTEDSSSSSSGRVGEGRLKLGGARVERCTIDSIDNSLSPESTTLRIILILNIVTAHASCWIVRTYISSSSMSDLGSEACRLPWMLLVDVFRVPYHN